MASSSAIQLGDLALTWDVRIGDADLSLLDLDLASDRGLATAMLLSFYLDRRAEPDDKPPSGDESDRRGWWGDEFAAVEGDKIGSRMWLLDRATRTSETAPRAKEYALEAWAWLIDDHVVSNLDVRVQTTERDLQIFGEVHRPGRDPVSFRFARTWDHVLEDM